MAMKKTNTIRSPLAAREYAGITQLELAHLSGVSIATISRCEKYGRFPRYPSVRALYMKALGMKP